MKMTDKILINTPDKYRYPTKTELAIAWAGWFESKSEEWNLYTVTVVFNNQGFGDNNRARWEDEYHKRFLGKIRKRLEPNEAAQRTAIPYDLFFYYEKDIASKYKLSGSKSPHHIHGLLPIRKTQDRRLWSDALPEDTIPRVWHRDNEHSLHRQLARDIKSIETIQDVLIEPVRRERTIDWVGYIAKCKQI
jgi:hypothetical protein